jgi:hypothetical protein
MDSSVFDGLASFVTFVVWVCAISLSLAVWKLVDIVIWLVHHISIHVH